MKSRTVVYISWDKKRKGDKERGRKTTKVQLNQSLFTLFFSALAN